MAGAALQGNCPACLLLLAMEAPDNPEPAPVLAQDSGVHPPGDLPRFFGDYEILSEISRGAMGVVVRARQRSLNRVVALKLMLDSTLASPDMVQRFQTEAEATARLDHPNIIRIYEVGQHQGRHFLSMEFVEGGTLADRLATAGTEARAALVSIMAKVARAVHHAHQRGILHRDLKPANILMDPAGEPRVTDFGLAKLADRSGSTLATQAGSVLGTPAYMAPEQAEGRMSQLTTSTDVYGLGAVLFHCLAGRPPFQATSVVETLKGVMESEPSFSERDPVIGSDQDLQTVCLKCLSKDPGSRYASALNLAEELERWMNHEPVLARPATSLERLRRACRKHPTVAFLSAAVVVLLVTVSLVSVMAWLRIRQEQRATQAAAQGTEQRLYLTSLALARGSRQAALPGWRAEALDALGKAALIKPGIEVRSEVLSALMGVDVRSLPLPTPALHANSPVYPDPPRQRFLVREDESVIVRALTDGHELSRLTRFPHPQSRLERFTGVSPDGRWMAARFDDGSLQLRRFSTAAFFYDLSRLGRYAEGRVAFHPDGQRLAYLQERRLVRVGWLTNLFHHVDVPVDDEVTRLAWSSDGIYLALAVAKGHRVRVCKGPDFQQSWESDPLATAMDDLVWQPGAARLVMAWAGGVEWISVPEESGARLKRESMSARVATTPRALQFNAKGNLLAETERGGVTRIWSAWAAREVLSIPAGGEAVFFDSKDSEVLVLNAGQRGMSRWEIQAGESWITAIPGAGADKEISGLAPIMAKIMGRGEVRLSRTTTDEEIARLMLPPWLADADEARVVRGGAGLLVTQQGRPMVLCDLNALRAVLVSMRLEW